MTTVSQFYFEVHSPALLAADKSGHESVRFILSIGHVDHGRIFSVPGWRVRNGKMLPPARKGSKFKWVPVIETDNEDASEGVLELVSDWKSDFPSVKFPDFGVGEKVVDNE